VSRRLPPALAALAPGRAARATAAFALSLLLLAAAAGAANQPSAAQQVNGAGALPCGDRNQPALAPGLVKPVADALAAPTVPAACLVNAVEAVAAVRRQHAVLIDVRRSGEFGGLTLPGSLVVDRAELPQLLGDTSAIVVGSGLDDAELLRACSLLNARGEPLVRLLPGGVAAWQRAGGALQGEAADRAAAAELGPAELLLLASRADTLLILGAGIRLPQLPGAATAIVAAAPDELDMRLLSERFAANPLASLVLAVPPADRAWLEVLDAPGMPVVWRYRQGEQAFSRWLADHQAVLAARSKSIEKGCPWN